MGWTYQYDNRVGITYVYETDYYYDPQTGKTHQKRSLIGKLDPDTKELIPTGKRGRPAKKDAAPQKTTDTAAASREATNTARYLEIIEEKEKAIVSLKEENRMLKADVGRLEKAIRTISMLCKAASNCQEEENQPYPAP